VLPSGEVRVLSYTSVQFILGTTYINGTEQEINYIKNSFRNTSLATFDQYDDLLQSMENSFNITTMRQNSTLWMEIKLYNSSADALICNNSKKKDGLHMQIMCAYVTMNTFTLKESSNLEISKLRENQPFITSYNLTTAISIKHEVPASKLISMDYFRETNIQASNYMASLGQNVYADYEKKLVYTIYDPKSIVEGFSAPDWLIISVFTVMAICLVFWVCVEIIYRNDIYVNSLYKIISEEIASAHDDPKEPLKPPTMMRSQLSPLKLEEYEIFSDGSMTEMDVRHTRISKAEVESDVEVEVETLQNKHFQPTII
jgi:hypothetical protein